MKLFKNSIGRPSNEILKKRRIFKICLVIGIAFLISTSFLLGYFNIINLRGYAAKQKIVLCSNTKVYLTDKSLVYYRGSGTYYIWGSTVSNGRIRITKVKAFAGKKGLASGWVKTSSLSSCSSNPSNYQLGDVNMNGKVDATDSRLILQHIAGLSKLDSEQLKYADVNKDGKVNATDSRLVLQIAAGIKEQTTQQAKKEAITMTKMSTYWNIGDSATVGVVLGDSSDSYTVESSKPNVMKISDEKKGSFKLTALARGTAKITATSKKTGKKVSYTYTVKRDSGSAPVSNAITMTKFTDEWQFGATGTASVTLKTSGDTFEVSSSNPNVIMITNKTNKSYKLNAIGEGSSTITATSKKTGQTVSYTYKIKSYKLPDNSRFGSNKNIKTKTVGGTTVYYENSCSTTVLNSYIKDIEYIKGVKEVKDNKDYPFKAVKAIYIVTKSSFDKANPGYSDSPAVTHGGAISYIDIKCDKYTKTSVAHELGHAIDYRYSAINGTMLSNSFENLYNKYVSLKSNRPLRDYSYKKTVDDAPYVEFFADSYTSYMGKATWSNFPGELKTEVKNAINKVINLQNW